ncbi:MAG: MBL fold metallo-hydrolase [Acidimicrobiia bacterium]|nr:MBL fold metallo-hydrolase [Acidimicrobiia bacterium]MBJ7381109.1 MBL fold metallo-hydrolase [Acidimicrobiia bacterium]MBJ7513569.1 MBL fold metallo-hydrolase [Acidimicrobiia bacterium]
MTHSHGRSSEENPASIEEERVSPPKRLPKQEQEQASETIIEVSPGVIRMQLPIWLPGLGHVNMYGLMDDRGIAVVDPGLPGPKSWKTLKARLKSAGFRVKDVHTVIVTHSHPDHFGAAGRIRRESGGELIAHRAFTTWSLDRNGHTLSEQEADRIEQEAIDEALAYTGESFEELPSLGASDEITTEDQRQSVPWGGPTPWGGSQHPDLPMKQRFRMRAQRLLFSPPDPTRRVRHGSPLTLGGREWQVVHTPGHTLDHLCLWDADGGVLLSGDHVLPTITPHVAGSAVGDSLRSYLATLDLVAHLPNVKLGLPAHGHPFTDVPGRVDAIKEHHAERMETLHLASVAVGAASVERLSHEVFPERHWGVMAESETFAHLEHLRRDGLTERWDDNGVMIYRSAPVS